MHRRPEPVISDSEPEDTSPLPHLSAHKTASSRSSRRRTSDERPGLSTGEADGREVLVLSSASEGEDENGAKPVTSSYFSLAATKRRKRPSSGTPDDWPFAGLVDREPRRSSGLSGARHASSDSRSRSGSGAELAIPTLPSPSAAPSTAPSHSPDLAPAASTSYDIASRAGLSFVSARDLLAASGSAAPRADDTDDELLPPAQLGRASSAAVKGTSDVVVDAPKKKKKKPTPAPPRSASVESDPSIEVLEPGPRGTSASRPVKAAPRRRRADKVVADNDVVVREDSAASGGSSTGSLPPPPSEWRDRFERGASSGAHAAGASRGDSQAPAPAPTPSSSVRRKPWEDLEAKLASGQGKKKAAKPRARAVKAAKAEVVEVDELASDEDDAAVVASNGAGRASSSRSASTAAATKPRSKAVGLLPTPMALPADARLRLLSSCPLPLCDFALPTTKALSTRQTHLRTCAKKLDITAATVSDLVDAQIVALSEAADAARLARADSRTQFDEAIGRGQGAAANADVHVVGVEGFDGRDPSQWYRAIKEVQDEFDLARKKAERPREAKLERMAKEIRRERAEAAKCGSSAVQDNGEDDKPHVGAAGADDDGDDGFAAMPAATGRLRAETPAARRVVVQRADTLLGSTSARAAPTTIDSDGDDVLDFGDGPVFTCDLTPPRPTQVLEPSLFAPSTRLDSDSSVEVLEAAAATTTTTTTSGATARRSRSPFRGLLLQDPCSNRLTVKGPQLGRRRSSTNVRDSLWRAAAGRDDAALKVVLKKRRHASDDDDDCLPRPARLPAPVRRLEHTASTAANAPSAASAPASDPAAAPPDYSSLSLAALQRKAAAYGFRPSKERTVLERQLAGVWRVLHPAGASATGGAEVGASSSLSSSSPPPKKTRGRKKKVVAVEEDDMDGRAAQADDEPVGEKLRRLVVADEGLYLRVLRYEPIHLDEFVALAAKGGVKIAKPLLVRFLDEQSITFFTQDPTGGTRRRYR
ncbi:uncharacterized protein RHOBADRAFT_54973 [Rhodotorula graminis WP1]|uniref:Structure-specific endonuclease subunit SLX4 n=1 Tax=Rhodotorula graminis (strain WP1) TaxID=578459 RepID=A0A0P9EWR8_RHOGW|nr:uncharacterized protein RHOBADRAFT_54973 [Rhodotorula graminis WP1]KPV73792.1 hypothetical protein RHOBADRAFT_54973 [Rhodotorula graminis WP1]